jgi:hypothetical protein
MAAHVDDDLAACQLASWYPTFAARVPGRAKGLTLKSILVPVPAAFYNYLAQDGVRLPLGGEAHVSSILGFAASNNHNDDTWSDDSSSHSNHNDTDEGPPLPVSSEPVAAAIDLEDLTQRLEAAIAALGGSVFCKTNWSAPRDASWMNQGSLKCQSSSDVYLLLQSSDFISSDLQLLQERGQAADLHIVLRKWCSLYGSQEFRGFVRQHHMVALTQRQTDQHFAHLVRERDDLGERLLDFFEDFVQHKYAGGRLANYVVDFYVDKQERVWIVDFNPWSSRTDSLLFSWDELNALPLDQEAEIRVVETAKEVLPQSLNNFRAPVDTVHLAALTGASPDKFQAFMDMCQRPGGTDDDSDED